MYFTIEHTILHTLFRTLIQTIATSIREIDIRFNLQQERKTEKLHNHPIIRSKDKQKYPGRTYW